MRKARARARLRAGLTGTRFQSAGGGYRVQTPPVGSQGVLYGGAAAAPLGTRPARGPKPPYRPNAQCHKQRVPNLNAARIGAGP